MQLIIVAVGQRMPAWVEAAVDEYARRFPPEMRLVVREVKPELRAANRGADSVMQAEAQRIRAAIPKRAQVIALDEHGTDTTTVQLAAQLERWRADGGDVVFLIGGADGLDPVLKAEAATRMRLSSMTLPHAMVRVILAEQLYRAWTVTTNHPYHRA